MENETIINDLSVTEAGEAEVKGGPKKIFIGGLSAVERQMDLLDLEPQGEIKGGPGSGWCTQCGIIYSNHNETVAEDGAEEINDLTVNNDTEIKGGPLKRIRVGGMSFGDENESNS